MSNISKVCKRCSLDKTLDNFSKNSSSVDGRQHYYRKCDSLYRKEYSERILKENQDIILSGKSIEEVRKLPATKKCYKCKETKTRDRFNKCLSKKDGLCAKCIECEKGYATETRKQRLTKNKDRQEKYRKENTEILSSGRTIQEVKSLPETKKCSNCSKVLSRSEFHLLITAFDGLNSKCKPCSISSVRSWRESNREKYRSQSLKRKTLKKSLFVEDISISKLRERDGSNCSYCKRELDFDNLKNVHIDHVIPLDLFGLHTPSNLVLSCPECNISKNSKNPRDWLLLKGYSASESAEKAISSWELDGGYEKAIERKNSK